MTDKQFKEMMTALVGIREALEDGFKEIDKSLQSIDLNGAQIQKLIDSLRTYTLGRITKGG